MICDKVIYRGQTILTIYHQGLNCKSPNRRIKQSEKIGRYNLTFIETFAEDTEIENIKDWAFKEEGLIEPDSTKNPYSDVACAYMVHYSYAKKPLCIYFFKDNKYFLKISIDDYLRISEFIKKYTGMDMESNPMFYGDVFIFRCNEREYKHNKSNGIILENIPANSTVIVHFKNGDMVVSSKILTVETETENLEICSDEPWSSHDIEIFNGEKLIYYKKNASYIKSISLQTQIKERGKTVKLNKIGTEYTIEKESETRISHIGELIDKYEDILQTSSWEIIKEIKSEKPDDQVFLIKPGELSKATKLIGSALELAKDELWIFDSYLTDKKGMSKILDWLRIIANCYANSKNVIFYCGDSNNALNISEIKSEIEKDSILSTMLRNERGIGIHFYQVKSPIHDRFVLIKNNNEYCGLSIGTSLNSLDKNHFCISKLSHAASKIIYNELILWMKDGNIILDEEV